MRSKAWHQAQTELPKKFEVSRAASLNMEFSGKYFTMRSKIICQIALGALFFGPVMTTHAQDYPDKTVRVIVPTAPGGGMDRVARIVSEKLAEKWGKPFTVENRAGAGGNLGGEQVFKAAPDGYTLMISATGPLINNKNLYAKLAYDSDRFVPVSLIAESPQALAVYSKVEAGSIQQLIALAKERPDKLNYGTPGNGTTPHLSAELFKSMANVKIVHVPFKGSPPAFAALLGGQIDMLFDAIGTMLPHIKAGTIRPLAVSGAKRHASLPDVPALNEVLPGYIALTWYGMAGPPELPVAIVNKLSTAIAEIVRQADVQKRMREISTEPIGSTPAEFAQFMKREREVWGNVIRSNGIAAD